jgi:exodeoxyribonuclease V alpha subunit
MIADRFDVRRSVRATGLLTAFNEASVLSAADVHVATRLADLAVETDPAVTLAAALAVRAPRLGHVHVDLATIRETATVDADEPVDLSGLPWPAVDDWTARVAASPLVAVGDEDGEDVRPLQLVGSWLYLNRYWREERQVAADLLSLAADPPSRVDVDVLGKGLTRLFPGATDGRQCLAAASAVLSRMAVVAGGPGTGKTTTVARIVALLIEQAASSGTRPPLVALAAPTGKAAARLQEAVHEEAAGLDIGDEVREQLLRLRASTLHRLLGWRPGSHSRYRHDRGQRLPHDVVIVDETSMVSLSMMGRLVEAIRPGARLVLVGDPGQLASIEAGAVLGDVVGPAAAERQIGPERREQLARATGHVLTDDAPSPGAPEEQPLPEAAEPPPAQQSLLDLLDPPPDTRDSAPEPDGARLGEAIGSAEAPEPEPDRAPIGDGIVVLDRVHRFGGGIAALAEAIRRGDADAVVELLTDAPPEVRWIDADVSAAGAALEPVRERATAAARRIAEAARAGKARDAIDALGSFRVLCAHRRGPEGVATWTARIEGWIEDEAGVEDRWYVGRPLLVTENDYELRLFNGDTGVVVQKEDRTVAAFERGGEIVEYSPNRLAAVDTVYAMTIHKSQGSQFDTAAVLVPGANSRILTRELLYTAVTRARTGLLLAGTEEAIRAAVQRPIARASGLRSRLWGT